MQWTIRFHQSDTAHRQSAATSSTVTDHAVQCSAVLCMHRSPCAFIAATVAPWRMVGRRMSLMWIAAPLPLSPAAAASASAAAVIVTNVESMSEWTMQCVDAVQGEDRCAAMGVHGQRTGPRSPLQTVRRRSAVDVGRAQGRRCNRCWSTVPHLRAQLATAGRHTARDQPR